MYAQHNQEDDSYMANFLMNTGFGRGIGSSEDPRYEHQALAQYHDDHRQIGRNEYNDDVVEKYHLGLPPVDYVHGYPSAYDPPQHYHSPQAPRPQRGPVQRRVPEHAVAVDKMEPYVVPKEPTPAIAKPPIIETNTVMPQQPITTPMSVTKENSTGSALSSSTIFKILLLVFAVLTAVAAGGWASTSYSTKKSVRRSSVIWAWGAALSLFISLIMVALIIATNNGSSESNVAFAAGSGFKQTGFNAGNSPNVINPGPEFDSAYLLPEKKTQKDTWTNRQRAMGLNPDAIEGPRKDFRHRQEVDMRLPRPMVPIEQTGLDQAAYEEYMQRMQGYTRPEEYQRYPYMPTAAQFEHEPHLDDAERVFGLSGQPDYYMPRARQRQPKIHQSDADINHYQQLPGGYQHQPTVHPAMEQDPEHQMLPQVFGNDMVEYDNVMDDDLTAEEIVEQIAAERKALDDQLFRKGAPSSSAIARHTTSVQGTTAGFEPPKDQDGNPILPKELQPIETRKKRSGGARTQQKQPQQQLPPQSQVPPHHAQQQQYTQPRQNIQPRQPTQSFATPVIADARSDDPFNDEFNSPTVSKAANSFASAFAFSEIASDAEINQLIREAERGVQER